MIFLRGEMDAITQQLVSLAVAALFGVATGYLGGKVRRLTERDRAIEDGVRAILRRELMDDFEEYVQGGRPLSMERRREIDECYAAYSALGGNGTGRTAYERICALHIEI